MERSEQCAKVGPRGGECPRRAILAPHGFLDFCVGCQRRINRGEALYCRKCARVVKLTGGRGTRGS